MPRLLLLATATLLLGGCVAFSPREPMYVADDLICGIDESVLDEQDKLLPSGALTSPYAPELWQAYWNHRAFYLGHSDFDEDYSGPSGPTYILYALQLRRETGLPDLVPEERNRAFVDGLYAQLAQNPRHSCDILAWRSPVCPMHAAQRPEWMVFRRGCGIPPYESFAPRPYRGE